MNEKRKNRLRSIIRVCMVAVAIVLLVVAVGIPIANNAVALGIQRELEALPMPADTTVQDAVSAAGKLVGSGNGMQYFGAVLLHSSLSYEELDGHFAAYRTGLFDCRLEAQTDVDICPGGQALNGDFSLSFSEAVSGEGYYILYTWGSAPAALRDWLNMDMRGH